MPTEPAPALDIEFARFAGDMAESLSFNRSLGQIYGLLYIHTAPLSLSDIGEKLSMSKGNVSINIRMLESWGAVRPVSKAGSRQDYYEANTDIKGIGVRRLREGLTKRLDQAEAALLRLKTAGPESKRLEDLRSLAAKARRALRFFSKWI